MDNTGIAHCRGETHAQEILDDLGKSQRRLGLGRVPLKCPLSYMSNILVSHRVLLAAVLKPPTRGFRRHGSAGS